VPPWALFQRHTCREETAQKERCPPKRRGKKGGPQKPKSPKTNKGPKKVEYRGKPSPNITRAIRKNPLLNSPSNKVQNPENRKEHPQPFNPRKEEDSIQTFPVANNPVTAWYPGHQSTS